MFIAPRVVWMVTAGGNQISHTGAREVLLSLSVLCYFIQWTHPLGSLPAGIS